MLNNLIASKTMLKNLVSKQDKLSIEEFLAIEDKLFYKQVWEELNRLNNIWESLKVSFKILNPILEMQIGFSNIKVSVWSISNIPFSPGPVYISSIQWIDKELTRLSDYYKELSITKGPLEILSDHILDTKIRYAEKDSIKKITVDNANLNDDNIIILLNEWVNTYYPEIIGLKIEKR